MESPSSAPTFSREELGIGLELDKDGLEPIAKRLFEQLYLPGEDAPSTQQAQLLLEDLDLQNDFEALDQVLKLSGARGSTIFNPQHLEAVRCFLQELLDYLLENEVALTPAVLLQYQSQFILKLPTYYHLKIDEPASSPDASPTYRWTSSWTDFDLQAAAREKFNELEKFMVINVANDVQLGFSPEDTAPAFYFEAAHYIMWKGSNYDAVIDQLNLVHDTDALTDLLRALNTRQIVKDQQCVIAFLDRMLERYMHESPGKPVPFRTKLILKDLYARYGYFAIGIIPHEDPCWIPSHKGWFPGEPWPEDCKIDPSAIAQSFISKLLQLQTLDPDIEIDLDIPEKFLARCYETPPESTVNIFFEDQLPQGYLSFHPERVKPTRCRLGNYRERKFELQRFTPDGT